MLVTLGQKVQCSSSVFHDVQGVVDLPLRRESNVAGVILDQQMSAGSPLRRSVIGSLLDCRQREREGRALAKGGVDPDIAAVALDDALAQGEATREYSNSPSIISRIRSAPSTAKSMNS